MAILPIFWLTTSPSARLESFWDPPPETPRRWIQAVNFGEVRLWEWMAGDKDSHAYPQCVFEQSSFQLRGEMPTCTAQAKDLGAASEPPSRSVSVAVDITVATFNTQSIRNVFRRGAKGRTRLSENALKGAPLEKWRECS